MHIHTCIHMLRFTEWATVQHQLKLHQGRDTSMLILKSPELAGSSSMQKDGFQRRLKMAQD